MSDKRPEQSIASARASVMVYDDVNKKWVPSGTSHGLSKVHIYHHFINNTFRVVGRKLQDHEVVINCAILKGLKYNQATPTFHQWRDNKQVYGLNFSSKDDAEVFATAMLKALEVLNTGGQLAMRPPPPSAVTTTSAPSTAAPTPLSQQPQPNNLHIQQQQQVPVYQQPHQHQQHATPSGGSGDPYDIYDEYGNGSQGGHNGSGHSGSHSGGSGSHPSSLHYGSDGGYEPTSQIIPQQQVLHQQQHPHDAEMERRLSLQQQSQHQVSQLSNGGGGYQQLHTVHSSPNMLQTAVNSISQQPHSAPIVVQSPPAPPPAPAPPPIVCSPTVSNNQQSSNSRVGGPVPPTPPVVPPTSSGGAPPPPAPPPPPPPPPPGGLLTTALRRHPCLQRAGALRPLPHLRCLVTTCQPPSHQTKSVPVEAC